MSSEQGGRARPYRGRFAPSPSGWLHLGNARTALVAWARARLAGGAFVMRVEDLDAPRTRPEAVLGNLSELRWLGLDWDEGPDVGGPVGPYRQSERLELYEAALDRLRAGGHLLRSYLSRREVAEIAAATSAASPAEGGAASGVGVDDAGEGPGEGAGALYGAAHRARDAVLAAERQAAGRPATTRFTVPEEPVSFVDALRGRVELSPTDQLGDFVVRRADGLIAYQLATVVDDGAMSVSEVVRGADLLVSTGAQLLLYRALGLRAPSFAHVGLLLDQHGQKLAKRHGALALRELELAGVRPERVVGLLAHTLGWLSEPRELTAGELLALLQDGGGETRSRDVALSEAELAWLLP